MSGREPVSGLLAATPVDQVEAEALGLEVACVTEVVGSLAVFAGAGGGAEHRPVDALLAWLALSPAGAAEVGRLERALAAATGRSTPVIDLVATPPEERRLAAARAKAERLEAALFEARSFTVELSRALAVLRREHQTVLERYAAVEARVAQVLGEGRRVCDIAPAGDPVSLGAGGALGERASMLLPFDISGLARIELSVVQTTPDARLRLSVEGLEAGEELLEWTRSGDALACGWNVFSAPRALDETPSSGRLWLQVETGAVTLDTGAPHPLPDLRVAGDGGAGEGPLALRAWTSIPGFTVGEPGPEPRGG